MGSCISNTSWAGSKVASLPYTLDRRVCPQASEPISGRVYLASPVQLQHGVTTWSCTLSDARVSMWQVGGGERRYHVVITAQGSAVHWQARVHYYWYKKVRAQCEEQHGVDCQMGGFTRILHSGRADELMDEIPTHVVEPLQDRDNKGCSSSSLPRQCPPILPCLRCLRHYCHLLAIYTFLGLNSSYTSTNLTSRVFTMSLSRD